MQQLQAMMDKLNNKFGDGTVGIASDLVSTGAFDKRIIETPSVELNQALYCGGFSGVVELYGPNSSGKTSLAIETIAYNQKKDPDFIAAWMETEHSISKNILQDHGVDLSRLVYWSQEDVGNAESSMDIARAFITQGNIDLLVVNSIAGLSPKTELETDLEKANVALTARLMSKFFRVSLGPMSKNNITAIFINQTRDNIGVMYGDTKTTTGGNALGYYAHQRIRMNQVSVQASDPIAKEDGVKISCIIKKNREAGIHNPYTSCNYYALFSTGIDSTVAIPAALLDANANVEQKGAHWYIYDTNGDVATIDGVEGHFKSKSDFIDILRNNKVWLEEMKKRLTVTSQTAEQIEEAKKEEENLEDMFEEIDAETNEE